MWRRAMQLAKGCVCPRRTGGVGGGGCEGQSASVRGTGKSERGEGARCHEQAARCSSEAERAERHWLGRWAGASQARGRVEGVERKCSLIRDVSYEHELA